MARRVFSSQFQVWSFTQIHFLWANRCFKIKIKETNRIGFMWPDLVNPVEGKILDTGRAMIEINNAKQPIPSTTPKTTLNWRLFRMMAGL